MPYIVPKVHIGINSHIIVGAINAGVGASELRLKILTVGNEPLTLSKVCSIVGFLCILLTNWVNKSSKSIHSTNTH